MERDRDEKIKGEQNFELFIYLGDKKIKIPGLWG